MKLGFCFLIKQGISQPSLMLWERFLASAPLGSFGIYVHAKTATPWPVLMNSRVDPSPLFTSWGDVSLVAATKRLFDAAVEDGCDAMVLVSGDMLPLQTFDWIRAFCEETRFSLQPSLGLTQRQKLANSQRFELISPYFNLPTKQLRKQNMFFVIQRDVYCEIAATSNLEDFPLNQLVDEYYWVNHLIRLGAKWQPSNVLFCNPNPTFTQALCMNLTRKLLESTRADGFAFIRKVKSVDDDAMQELKAIYSSF